MCLAFKGRWFGAQDWWSEWTLQFYRQRWDHRNGYAEQLRVSTIPQVLHESGQPFLESQENASGMSICMSCNSFHPSVECESTGLLEKFFGSLLYDVISGTSRWVCWTAMCEFHSWCVQSSKLFLCTNSKVYTCYARSHQCLSCHHGLLTTQSGTYSLCHSARKETEKPDFIWQDVREVLCLHGLVDRR